jgi:hypothetical protein
VAVDGSCALCVLQGVRGACPHHGAPDTVVDETAPGNGGWPQFPGSPPPGRRTLSADEALDVLDRMLIAGELIEIEHTWPVG